jgi:hypothetical protein
MLNSDSLASQTTKINSTSSAIKKSLSIGAIALGLAATLALPLKSSAQETQTQENNVTIEKLTDDVEQYIGQTVTIRSQVEQEIDLSGYILQSDEFFGGEPVLVFNPDGSSLNRPGDDVPLQATGTVREFILADIEREYGVDLDDQLYADYENQPAIIADYVALAPTIQQLADNPSDYYDRAIAVEGEVGQSFSPNTFALYEEGWIDDIGLLVMGVNRDLSKSNNAVEAGEYVVVTGVVRPFDAQMLQEEPGLGWSEQQIQEFESRYTDRPVITAETIYPSAVNN